MLIHCQLYQGAAMSTSQSQISTWGNGLALRLTKPIAKIAGVVDGTKVRIVVKPGRIVIEADIEPSLEAMLAAFDPKRHGGEAMAFAPVGVEVL
jgi:antitoxin MazE